MYMSIYMFIYDVVHVYYVDRLVHKDYMYFDC